MGPHRIHMASRSSSRPERADLDEARERWLAFARPLAAEIVPVAQVGGRVLAEAAVAAHALPPFDRSAVDGYAIRAADTASITSTDPAVLPVSGEVPAGQSPCDLPPGCAVRVNTGSAMPAGADSVAMVEWTTPTEFRGRAAIVLSKRVPSGANIRVAGEDAALGSMLAAAGTRVGADVLPLVLAGLAGRPTRVTRRPRVVVVPTGSELCRAGDRPRAFSVPDVVGPGLALRIAEGDPGADVWVAEPVPDGEDLVEEAIRDAVSRADLVCTVGGAGLGTRDHTARAIERLGGEIVFHGLALRPGTPSLGARMNGVLVLGLPGNPVAALTVWDLLGPHALARLSGSLPPVAFTAVLERALTKRPAHEDRYLRAVLKVGPDGIMTATVDPQQNAGMLGPLARTNGLVCHPRAVTTLEEGSRVWALLTGRLDSSFAGAGPA